MTARHIGVELEPVQTIPPEADVCHVDELDDEVIAHLSELVTTNSYRVVRADETVVQILKNCSCDIIKFTEFYHIAIL